MASKIRPAAAPDAASWLELVRASFGDNYPAKEVYDLAWIESQLGPDAGTETWVVENDGRMQGAVSMLRAESSNANPVANIGRNLFRPEAFLDGSAAALLRHAADLALERKQMVVARVSATDNAQQIAFENLGFACVGFQPLKHILRQRLGVLFYVQGANAVLATRTPLSESLPQVSELGMHALESLQIHNSLVVRDGASGYPLQSDLKVHDGTQDDFDLWRVQADAANPPVEVSGRFNFGFGLLRLPFTAAVRAFLGQRDEKMVAGLAYYFDEHDKCVRLTESFCSDDLSIGALLAHAVKAVQEQFNAVYTEMDVLATAPRLLKSAEQLGFVPVAYLPAFFSKNDRNFDVVKMVKLNLPYSVETADFTAHARVTVEIIDRSFQDQKLGLAIINLLRPLSMFHGLGDGELRKIARLFVQKLYRAGDEIFAKGALGEEAYVLLRGKINIHLDPAAPPIAQLGEGKIFGELAFLDGAPRVAFAVAAQPSILLVMQRAAFNDLVRREPNLGMAVMRNLALDLAMKLRGVNDALSNVKKK
ncbi:MAG TPA: cyclic nucleotide-binding domain-containing protein [Verrucomicrobiae bacterium]|nr:cyclic nucleotide-binding domain-containing protein [Verrucomicrobiae bacterium]